MSIEWKGIELLTDDDYNKSSIVCFGKGFDAGEHHWTLDIITHFSLINNPIN